MNIRLVAYLLGIVCLLIGGAMTFSLPWAFQQEPFEWMGVAGLVAAMILSAGIGSGLMVWGAGERHKPLYRKEAMAVVGLSWVVATGLGAVPYLVSVTMRAPEVPMTVADALFESQSGFSTTGATILTKIENPDLVPRCILFWRSSTHFLGGLGIIVLFVAILGQGSAGKALMRAEIPGPTKETGHARTQYAAWRFATIYVVLTVVLAALLMLEGLSLFDALCHAFGTMATGGFSTYDASLGHFGQNPEEYPYSAAIEMTVLLFMVLAGTNFTLLYLCAVGKATQMLGDIEWRVYIGILVGVSALVMAFGIWYGDFQTMSEAFRYGGFQVVSIMTTTGFGTHDFDGWNSFGRGVLFLLMFWGGCAGSTGGGLKVIRHVMFLKILWLEIEKAYHPSVVRPLRLGGKALEEQELRHNVVVYFALVLVIFVFSWMTLVAMEPDAPWIDNHPVTLRDKLIDCASAVAATLNNIGPGLGTIGATQNYAHFSWWSKLLLTWLMMLGRLELFVILVLFVPGFWRSR